MICGQYLFSPPANTVCKYTCTYLKKTNIFDGQMCIAMLFVYAQIQAGEQSSDFQFDQEMQSTFICITKSLVPEWFFLIHHRQRGFMDVADTLHSARGNQVPVGAELTVGIRNHQLCHMQNLLVFQRCELQGFSGAVSKPGSFLHGLC